MRVLGGLAVPPAQAVIRDRMSCPAGSSQLDACLTLNWKPLILWWVNTDCSSLQLMEPSPLRAMFIHSLGYQKAVLRGSETISIHIYLVGFDPRDHNLDTE